MVKEKIRKDKLRDILFVFLHTDSQKQLKKERKRKGKVRVHKVFDPETGAWQNTKSALHAENMRSIPAQDLFPKKHFTWIDRVMKNTFTVYAYRITEFNLENSSC